MPALVFEILQLALAIIQNPSASNTADLLLQIVQKGQLAYAQHVGQPLDPSLIQVETPV